MKYFFAQDESCHWYMIPVDKRNRWNQLNGLVGIPGWTEEDYYYATDDEFGQYRTGGGISDIEFIIL